MRKESTESRSESRPEWEQLEDWVRSHPEADPGVAGGGGDGVSGKGEVGAQDSDSDTGYHGYGRARRLTLSSGTIQLRRPRVRDTEEQFESRLLPLFVNRTRKVAELIPELYLHGLSEGDFDLALRGLLGEDASVSASTVARLKSKWNDELAQWRSRPLDDLEVVYMWVDGVYVKAGLEKEKAALVVMAALSDGSKVVVICPQELVRGAQGHQRGLSCPMETDTWASGELCATSIRRRQSNAAQGKRALPRCCVLSPTRRLRLSGSTVLFGDHSYEPQIWDRMVTFYDFPKGRGRTRHPSRPSGFGPMPPSATRGSIGRSVIWKMLMVAEQRFRRLKAPVDRRSISVTVCGWNRH